MPKQKLTSGGWQNRIVGSGQKPAKDFLAHEANWRTHGKHQRSAINGALAEIGWVQNVIVNKNSGKIIDGHLRVEEALAKGDDVLVPFIEVDLTDEEERKVLAFFDPISSMAGEDSEKFRELMESLQFVNQDLNEFAENLTLEFQMPEFKEYDESVEHEVEFVECPKCRHRFPK